MWKAGLGLEEEFGLGPMGGWKSYGERRRKSPGRGGKLFTTEGSTEEEIATVSETDEKHRPTPVLFIQVAEHRFLVCMHECVCVGGGVIQPKKLAKAT